MKRFLSAFFVSSITVHKYSIGNRYFHIHYVHLYSLSHLLINSHVLLFTSQHRWQHPYNNRCVEIGHTNSVEVCFVTAFVEINSPCVVGPIRIEGMFIIDLSLSFIKAYYNFLTFLMNNVLLFCFVADFAELNSPCGFVGSL